LPIKKLIETVILRILYAIIKKLDKRLVDKQVNDDLSAGSKHG